MIPSAARVVTLALTETANPTAGVYTAVREPRPVTVTDPVKVRRTAALLGGLPLAPTGSYSCPSGTYLSDLTLTFNPTDSTPHAET